MPAAMIIRRASPATLRARAQLEAALERDDVEHQAYAEAAVSHLKQLPELRRCLATGREKGWEAAAAELLGPAGQAILGDTLLHKALCKGLVVDAELELLLTALRKAVLCRLGPERLAAGPALTGLLSALAIQCANNEHVFYISDEEHEKVRQLSKEIQTAAFTTDAEGTRALLLSLYLPLQHVFAKHGKDLAHTRALPAEFRPLAARFMRAWLAERRLLGWIESIGEIHDQISQELAAQYEANPYPRWLGMGPPKSGTAPKVLGQWFSAEELAFTDDGYDMLVAGCGTGKQAIHAAISFGPKAQVLAVDLSRASLAYAMRMARGYKVPNLRFAQADILELGALDRTFRVIWCAGVLHHMADPMAGWRCLVERLAPGGVMLVALYSRAARTEISALRREIARLGIPPEPDAMRRFRHELIVSGRLFASLHVTRDFFSMSGVRDLLFNVVEHQFTLPEIGRCLDELGLEFRGLQVPEEVQALFDARFKGSRDRFDIASWDALEKAHPRAFEGMYHIVCGKAGAAA